MSDVAPRDLSEELDDLRTRCRLFEEYLDARLARIADLDRRIRAFLPEPGRRERLLREFGELRQAFPAAAATAATAVGEAGAGGGKRRPPLFGALVGVKDLFHVDGLPTTAGSRLPPEVFADRQAEAVNRLRRAGALVLGKTVTTEFAYFSPGPTRNPWNLEHTPGGSSSGSAAAVAAGLTPLALGTQTIGSVTRPAAFCGIVGFKPSLGRMPADGIVPFSRTMDQAGLFAATVASVATGAAVVCDNWSPRKPNTKRSLSVGLLEDPYVEQAEESARRAVVGAAERLAAAGYGVKRLALFPNIEAINALHLDLIAREFAQLHEQWYAEYGSLYSEKSKELIKKGRAVTEARAEEARRHAESARSRVEQTMRQAGVSAVLSPASVGEAPAGIEATGSPIMNLPWTFFGLPTVTVPCGLGPQGLPLGLQIAGYYQDDEHLMSMASAVEAALGPLRPAG